MERADTSRSNVQAQELRCHPAIAALASQTNAQLLAQVESRNPAAWEVLYDRHSAQALRLALRILEDRAQAERVVQEAFWWVWKYAFLARNTRADFSRWFCGIVEHLAMTELNRELSLSLPDSWQETARMFKQSVTPNGDNPQSFNRFRS